MHYSGLTSNRKVQTLRGHKDRINAGLWFVAARSWSSSCSFSETGVRHCVCRQDSRAKTSILVPDTELLWTTWNMPFSISHHYFKLLWLIGDSFLFSVMICSVFSISCSGDLTVEPEIPTKYLVQHCHAGKLKICNAYKGIQLFLTFNKSSLFFKEINANLVWIFRRSGREFQ